MSRKVVWAQAVRGHRLRLRFDDGVEGEVNLKEYVPFDGVFAPLADPEFVARVRVNRMFGTVCWPNASDLDPVVLYAHVTGTPFPKWATEEAAAAESPRSPRIKPRRRATPGSGKKATGKRA